MAAEDAIAAQYIAAQAALRVNLLTVLARLWESLTSWRDADAERFAAQATPVVAGAQQATATYTAAYLARMAAEMTGSPLRMPDVRPSSFVGEAVRPVPPSEVYQRPFKQIWTDLSQDKPLDQAVQSGQKRLNDLASTDVQLAKTHTSRAVLDSMANVVGYRRVLTGAENCGMCFVASTQRYHGANLMPIHPGCDCAVAPIIGHEDPGQIINSAMLTEGAMPTGVTKGGTKVYQHTDALDAGDLLEPVHKAIQDRFGVSDRGGRLVDYRHILLVQDHGELGPVLTVARHKFTAKEKKGIPRGL